MVGGPGGRAGAAGARALRIQAGGVQELGVRSHVSRGVEGQLLLLQELDFLQFLLELLVLELLLLMHALGRETHIQTSAAGPPRETSRQEERLPVAEKAGAPYTTPRDGTGPVRRRRRQNVFNDWRSSCQLRLASTAHSPH